MTEATAVGFSLGEPAPPPIVSADASPSADKYISVEPFREIVHRVDALPKLTGQPRDYYIHEILECLEYLDAKRRLGPIAAERFADLEAGRTAAIPIEDVMREYGLEN
jgi:predicted DNA-binding protein